MSRPRLYSRKFLNKPGHHAGAYVLVEVQDTTSRTDPELEAWVEFRLADCNRLISLEFDLGAKERRNSLHKARVLLDAVSRFVEALEAEAALAEARERADRQQRRAS